MEVESGLVMMNSAVEKVPSKASCLETIITSELGSCCSMEMGPELNKVEKVVNGTNLVLLESPSENMKGMESQDTVCKLDNNTDMDDLPSTLESGTLELSTSSSKAIEEDFASGCQTPTESIFDPFAPGPEELVFAPKKKVIKGTEIPLRRQLNFELSDHPVKDLRSDVFDDTQDDDRLLELVRVTFLDLIIANQALEAHAQNSLVEASSCDGFRTPTSVPVVSGIAETCPAAPLRPTVKLQKLSPSICRKLDFGSDSSEDL